MITSAAASLLFLCGALQARTMYLSTSGDDSAPAAQGAEFRTLAVATARLAAGDTLIVREGTYEGGVVMTVRGAPKAPVLLHGESPDAEIKGSPSGIDALRIQDCSYVILEQITFRNAGRAGCAVRFSDHVTVRGCRFLDNEKWGLITSFADDFHFENNECAGSKVEHGIYHANSGDRFIIRGNRVHDNAGNGIHMNGDPEMGGDGVLNYGVVESNIIYGNGQAGGAGINMTHVHDILVRNNLVYNNYAAGITIYQDTGTFEQGSKRVALLGNTVVFRTGYGRACLNVQTTTEKVLAAGNIFVTGNVRGTLQMDTEHLNSVISDCNLHWGSSETELVTRGESRISLGAWRSLSGNDTRSALADPKFSSVDAADYELSSGSPAIDLGMPLDSVRAGLVRLGGCEWLIARLDFFPDEDIRGTWRPVGARPDAGAYETGLGRTQRLDYNGDRTVSLADAVALCRIICLGLDSPRTDFNADGRAGIRDVLALLIELAGL